MERAVFVAAAPVSRPGPLLHGGLHTVDQLAFQRRTARGGRRDNHAYLAARHRVEGNRRAEIAVSVGGDVRLERARADLQKSAERAGLTARDDVYVRAGQRFSAKREIAADFRSGAGADR